MRRARPYRGENPEPARMFMESLTSGPELENTQDPQATFGGGAPPNSFSLKTLLGSKPAS